MFSSRKEKVTVYLITLSIHKMSTGGIRVFFDYSMYSKSKNAT